MAARMRVAALISGRGSNLEALIEAARTPGYPAEIALVVSNVAGAAGLKHAAAAGIDSLVIEHGAYPDRETFDRAMDAVLRERKIDLICLAGFMRLLSPAFVTGWLGRLINIHPSLLPAFKGLHPHRQALEAGVKLHGCTVHFVTPEVDDGPIIAQAAVPVREDDDETALAARVLEAEHTLYPLAVRLIGGGQVSLQGQRTRISGIAAGNGDDVFINPGFHPAPDEE
ncbi:MAG: phosphoribosylglycinamide formyltransferase [Rhodospirillaceae bacterium]|nr:phosphoribosylglycinamide formyltransferase [Rhodospirillaceae bacterium]